MEPVFLWCDFSGLPGVILRTGLRKRFGYQIQHVIAVRSTFKLTFGDKNEKPRVALYILT